MKARVVEVIMVEDGLNRIYMTLEGVEIGSFKEGKKIEPVETHEDDKPKGGIVRSLTPQQVRVEQGKEIEENMTLEKRIEHAKESQVS